MGQREIREYLKKQYEQGYKGFFTAAEVSQAIGSDYSSTCKQINQMLEFDQLQRNCVYGWKLAVRINPSLLKKIKHTTD